LLVLLFGQFVHADELAEKSEAAVHKGLTWLAAQQQKDGHWEGNNGQYPVPITALSGLTLLMEGSTLREGKYADPLRRAVDWLGKRAQPNGLIGDPDAPNQRRGGYNFGHAYAMVFLANVYAIEEDAGRRKKLELLLTKAIAFAGNAQTSRGGWGYVAASDGSDFDEGCVTQAQLEGLAVCHSAGLVVPGPVMDKASEYLKKATTPNGGVIYTVANGQAVAGAERPPITAHAAANQFALGERHSDLARRWLRYCRQSVPVSSKGYSFDEYTHRYYAQALYQLGDEGYAKLFPDLKPEERLTWNQYRRTMTPFLLGSQLEDGSWKGLMGSVYGTTMRLFILQLDKGALPVYQ
jgi:hypothetical protein